MKDLNDMNEKIYTENNLLNIRNKIREKFTKKKLDNEQDRYYILDIIYYFMLFHSYILLMLFNS